MLTVLLIWAEIALTTWLCGRGTLRGFGICLRFFCGNVSGAGGDGAAVSDPGEAVKRDGAHDGGFSGGDASPDSADGMPAGFLPAMLAGLVTVNVYAQVFSLFAGVGAVAQAGLLALSALCGFFAREDLLRDLESARRLCGYFAGRDSGPEGRGGITHGASGTGKGSADDGASGAEEHAVPYGRIAAGVFLLLLTSFAAAQGTWHIDTPLYHAMSIHWIEEYGVVKGLGNLQTHFAYNNACFPLFALYSFSFLGGQSFHAVQGFLLFLTALLCLPLADIFRRGYRPRLSDCARLAAVCYMSTVIDEILSPAADYYFVLLVFIIAILWLQAGEELSLNGTVKSASGAADSASGAADSASGAAVHSALLCMLAVYAATVKLAAAPLIALSLYPVAVFLAHDRKTGERSGRRAVLLFFLTGVFIALPFFIRNYLLSGYLLFPVAQTALFHPVWQIPRGTVLFEAYDIEMTGRAIFTFTGEPVPPVHVWFPFWFSRLSKPVKVLFLGAAAGSLAIPAVSAHFAGAVLSGKRRFAEDHAADNDTKPGRASFSHPSGYGTGFSPQTAVLFAVLVFSFWFWFCSTPQIRFGQAYIWLLCALVYGTLFLALPPGRPPGQDGKKLAALRAGAALLLAANAVLILLTLKPDTQYLVRQQDYPLYECETYLLDGFTFYMPVGTTTAGYYSFPSTRWKVENVRALGESLADGFAPVSAGP